MFIVITGLIMTACKERPLSDEDFVSEGDVVFFYDNIKQTIDGFGGSDAWMTLPSNAAAANEVVKLLYSKTEGAGFTILRNRIPFRERLAGDTEPSHNDGFLRRNNDNTYNYTESGGVKTFNLNWNSWDLAGTKNLITRIKNLGADGPGDQLTIMSTPWTPPNNRVTRWKEDVTGAGSLNGAINWNTPDVWGRLKRAFYNDYADLLADYVKNFQANMGHPLSVLSIQNEPNMKVSYESAYMNGNDIRDFLKTISERFPLKSVFVNIMAPEFENYDINFNSMVKPSLDDQVSNNVLTHIALHQYNAGWDSGITAGTVNGLAYFPQIAASGKRFWQTEISNLGPHCPDDHGIENALYYARMIHFNMTMAGTNAFLFWWLWQNTDSNEVMGGSLITVRNGTTVIPAKRLYAMGQYSRFVRPGWVRIEAEAEPVKGVFISAYKNPSGNEIAIVMINTNVSSVDLSIGMGANRFESLNSWRTSSSENLTSLGKQEFNGGNADISLSQKSITTFYGTVR